MEMRIDGELTFQCGNAKCLRPIPFGYTGTLPVVVRCVHCGQYWRVGVSIGHAVVMIDEDAKKKED